MARAVLAVPVPATLVTVVTVVQQPNRPSMEMQLVEEVAPVPWSVVLATAVPVVPEAPL